MIIKLGMENAEFKRRISIFSKSNNKEKGGAQKRKDLGD